MKAISKSNGSRLHRATRGDVSLAGRKPLHASDVYTPHALDMGLDAADEELDLEHLDFEAIEAGIDDDDAPVVDWLSDHDLALQIAQGVLH